MELDNVTWTSRDATRTVARPGLDELVARAGRSARRRHEFVGKRKGTRQRKRQRKRVSRTVLDVLTMGTQSKGLPKRKRQTGSRRRRRTATMGRARRRQARTQRERKRIQGTMLDLSPVGTQSKELPQRRTRSDEQR